MIVMERASSLQERWTFAPNWRYKTSIRISSQELLAERKCLVFLSRHTLRRSGRTSRCLAWLTVGRSGRVFRCLTRAKIILWGDKSSYYLLRDPPTAHDVLCNFARCVWLSLWSFDNGLAGDSPWVESKESSSFRTRILDNQLCSNSCLFDLGVNCSMFDIGDDLIDGLVRSFRISGCHDSLEKWGSHNSNLSPYRGFP